MTEQPTGDVPVEDPRNAATPETRERPSPEDRRGVPDKSGAAPGNDPKDDPDAEGEERFDAG